ncbi:MAG TPA: hypothetical protein VE196_04100 [Pseudonocardiaceae bacterium]|jgi:hypothetical protein|nr:hypothetical protein [Pseudonocardiaceae bacterium]
MNRPRMITQRTNLTMPAWHCWTIAMDLDVPDAEVGARGIGMPCPRTAWAARRGRPPATTDT